MPVVNFGTRSNPLYLPPEVCEVLPGKCAGIKLNTTQSQKMIDEAVKRPWENAEFITRDGFDTVGLSNETNPLLV